VLAYKRRKKPMEIERERGSYDISEQSLQREKRRKERRRRLEGRSCKGERGFVLKVVKLQIILGASNLLFHHSLVRSFYTRACSPKSCCCLR